VRAFLECVAQAVMGRGVRGLCEFVPGGPYLFDVAGDALRLFREKRRGDQLREEVSAAAAASADDAKRIAAEVAQEVASSGPPEDRLALELYLTQIPAAVRASLKRAADPTGRTVPPDLALDAPADLLRVLPAGVPKFRPGDALPGRPGWGLVELLGSGGFGEVWLVRHTFIPHPRAVKFCTDPLAKAKLASHEGQVIARVMGLGHHPNIVPLLDAALDGDSPWLMYEYVGGGSLTDLVHRWQALVGADRERAVVAALHELAAAVGHFHRLAPPIVHRDLKPSNILVGVGGSTHALRITDFGIGGVAVDYLRTQHPRATGLSAGWLETSLRGSYTPLYASPQQRGGGPPDPRDDVHALGVIGYQLATGRLDQAPGIDAAEDLTEAGIGAALVALLSRCVAQKAERRPKDAGELAEKLAGLLGATRTLPLTLTRADAATPPPAPPPGGEGCLIPTSSRDTAPAEKVPGQSVGASPPFPLREGGPGGLGGSARRSPGTSADVVNPSPQPPPPGGEGVPAQRNLPTFGSAEPGAGQSVGTSPPFPLREGGPGGLGGSGLHGFARRGRYGRFFAYLSLFAFSMLNLLIADNLFQVFVSWELVGVCSFFLIGFYYERPSASRAAAKAFIVNRVGDAGFLVGIFIAWTSLGTLNIEELTRRVRSPERDTHGSLEFAHQLVRVNPTKTPNEFELPAKGEAGSHLALFPPLWEDPTHFHGLGYKRTNEQSISVPPEQRYFDFGAMPYWLFVVMGAGIFLGCVGKSAQVPLHTWLPDAMEGPTPVSALIHAATMVAAGVYLVGRCYVLFAPEVLLGIAYTGAVTLFVAATIALVQTDIKRVLAYSTCSQLGYMMLALGVGGWAAGLLHLLTHAFFKALLFLGSGSVIHGCHHEQDLRKMGGLLTKMRITGLTMLVGVLAIAGAPLFSGWYSKDQVLSSALGYGLEHRQHFALFVLPLLTAAMTGFYMFRLWFLAFTGAPRDHHVHDHAHESPAVMTVPLIVLALFSLGVAWGWPVWDADASALGRLLEAGRPAAWLTMFGAEAQAAHDHHLTAGALALLAAVLGAGLAAAMYWRPKLDPAAVRARAGGVYTFLLNKWYFDEAYDAALVKPAVGLAFASAAADKRPTDGETDAVPPRRYDVRTLDGLITTAGQLVGAAGAGLRRAQTGRLRGYVLVLALTVAGLLGMLLGLGG